MAGKKDEYEYEEDEEDYEGLIAGDEPDEASSEEEEDQDPQERFMEMVKVYGVELNEDGEYPGFCSDPFCLKDFQMPVLKRFMPRVAACLLLFTIGLYINNVSQAWLQQNISGYYEKGWKPVPPVNSTVILWDVVFETFPLLPSTKPSDTIATVVPSLMFIRFAVLPGPMSLRWTILCRVLICWGLLWFFRAFTIWTTPLPNPDPTCKPQISFPNNVFLEAWANLPFIFWYNELTCQDVMYSGHTMAITLPMLTILRYVPLSPWGELDASREPLSISTALNIVGCGVMVLGYYLIIASHFHYTVDVMVGALVSAMVFFGFHNNLKAVLLQSGNTRSVIQCFLQWLEKTEVGGRRQIVSKDSKHWRRMAKAKFTHHLVHM